MRRFVFILFLLISLVAGVGGYYTYQGLQYRSSKSVTLLIERGTPLRQIANTLAKQNVISSPWIFEGYVRATSQDKDLQAGEYQFRAGINVKGIVRMMTLGQTVRYQVNIPEGFAIKDICKRFVHKKLMSKDKCQELTSRKDWLENGEEALSLEGYLFPATYSYNKLTTPEDMIKQMVATFYKNVTPSLRKEAKKQGLSLHRLVTFASLIEKETGVPWERPLIAGVFHNRLKRGMMLQTDPTVIYGIKNFDGNLTRKHLTTYTEYNTYMKVGLPPGPIASPGLDAIKAVLYPVKTDALYFVAKGGGKHYFSKTLAQHNRAVQYYQLKRGAPPPDGEEKGFEP